MAKKREYVIEVQGVREAFGNVSSLAEVLDKLTDKVVNVTSNVDKVTETTNKNTSATKENASSTDALSKAQQKLAEFDAEYEKELQQVNSELSKQKKAVKEAIQEQEAQSVVEQKQLNSYAEKQKYLTSLNKLIRTHANVTEEDKAEIQAMVQESAQLQAELKEFDEQMKIYTRNVGNYPGAAQMVIDSNKSMKQEVRELTMEMAEMLANGVDKIDPKFLALAKRAGELKDAMADASDEVKHFASDTAGIDNVINLATTATSVWGLYNSALTVFGEENKEVAESMQKMMAIMQMLQSLQAIQNTLTANGSATAKIYTTVTNALASALGLKSTATASDTATTRLNTTVNEENTVSEEANAAANAANAAAKEAEAAATTANTMAETANTGAETANTAAKAANTAATGANTTSEAANTASKTANATATGAATAAQGGLTIAQKAGAVASKTLSVAMRSIPIMFLIGLVIDLINHWKEIWNWFKKTIPILGQLGGAFKKLGGFINTMKAILRGFGEAVVNWVINPLRTLGKVMAALFKLDFEGAWNAMKDGLTQQFKGTVDAFKNGFQAQVEEGMEEMRAKAAEEANKTTQQELAELKIRERNNKTYSKKYIELQKKDFEQRRIAARGNKEELDKIKLEEMQFDADVEDKKTAYAKEQQQERTRAAKAAQAERKKIADKAASDANKAAEEYKKRIQELYKAIEDIVKQGDSLITKGLTLNLHTIENNLKRTQEFWEYYYKGLFKRSKESNDSQIKQLDNYSRAIESVIFKRKMLIYNTFAEEAQETKKTYQAIIAQITSLIEKTSQEAAKATGDTKTKLELNLVQLNETLAKVKANFKLLFDNYMDNDFTIPLSFDEDAIMKRYKNLMLSLDPESYLAKSLNMESVMSILTDFDNHLKNILEDASQGGEEISDRFYKMIEILTGSTEGVDKLRNAIKAINNDLLDVGELPEGFERTKKAVEEGTDVMKAFSSDASQVLFGTNLVISQLGILSKEAIDKMHDLDKEHSDHLKKIQEDTLKDIISNTDKLLSYADKTVKKFQEATKGLKIEPVKVDDSFTKIFDGQIISIDKTRERYEKLRKSYEEYEEVLRESMNKRDFEKAWQDILDKTKKKYGEESDEYKQMIERQKKEAEKRMVVEAEWHNKLKATKDLYGEESLEYKLLLDEKAKSDAAYVLEYEKSQEQIQQIDKKTNSIYADYAESLGKRIEDIYKAFSENMFEPLAEGFTALLDYQIEEAEKRLEDIEELLDKAVELRKDSEERIEEINQQLKDSDTGNKEHLKQQLADEQVLLVQRQQTERDLNKQKEREEALIKKKEKQQRKIELGQKLIEGIVNTALGVTAALKYGPILGPIFAAIIGAMGALQTGIIIKQMSKLEKGGRIKDSGLVRGEDGSGRRHSQGGHRIEGTNIEVELDEWVVNRRSSKKYNKLIEAINNDDETEIVRRINGNDYKFENGGNLGSLFSSTKIVTPRSMSSRHNTYVTNYYGKEKLVSSTIQRFASGGKMDYGRAVSSIEQNATANRVTDAISQINFNPVVSVVDIQKKEASLTKVRDLAGK